MPEPWVGDVTAALRLIEFLDAEINDCEAALRRQGATHPYVPTLMPAPGIGPVLGYTIAAEIGDISRFPTPKKLVGYTGLCPSVDQSSGHDWRGSLAKNGPKYLRWALIAAATHASRHPVYRDRYRCTKIRLSRQRGPSIARVDIARRPHRGDLAHAYRQQALRSGRRHNYRSGRVDDPSLRRVTGAKRLQPDLILPTRRR